MARVLLKREWRTPYGRFKRSIDGEPTKIPDLVIERMRKAEMKRKKSLDVDFDEKDITGLPRDAEVVGADYKSPAQIMEETGGLDEVDPGRTAAEMEAEIQRQVEERLAELDAAKAAKAGKNDDDEDEEGGEDILRSPVQAIIEKLPELSVEELEDLLERENESKKPRTTLVAEIEAAIEDLGQ